MVLKTCNGNQKSLLFVEYEMLGWELGVYEIKCCCHLVDLFVTHMSIIIGNDVGP